MARLESQSFSVPYGGATLSGDAFCWQKGDIIHLVGDSESSADELCFFFAGLIDVISRTDPAPPGQVCRVPRAVDPKTLASLTLDGKPLHEMDPIQRARQVGVVFGNPELYVVGDTLLEEFNYTFAAINRTRPDIHALERYGLYGKSSHRTEKLSGGELHRLNWCCTLEVQPKMVIADLSKSNLDPDFTGNLVRWLEDGRGDRITVVHGLRPGAFVQAPTYTYHVSRGRMEVGAGDPKFFPTLDEESRALQKEFAPRPKGALLFTAEGVALRDVTEPVRFDLHENEVLQIRGPNGVGKTTLGKLLSGRIARRKDKMAGHTTPLLDAFSPVMTLQFPERFFLRNSVQEELPFDDLLAIGDFTATERDTPPALLCFSRRKLLASAVALKRSSGFAILDEPTAGMDFLDKVRFIRLLNHFQNLPVIMFSHDEALNELGNVKQWSDIKP